MQYPLEILVNQQWKGPFYSLNFHRSGVYICQKWHLWKKKYWHEESRDLSDFRSVSLCTLIAKGNNLL
jgi:hypothetical protein